MKETERKYDVDPLLDIPDLGGLPGVRKVEVVAELHLDATYLDSADHRLIRSGITLRHRSGGADAGWHLKLPVSSDTREELQRPLDGATTVPPSLSGLLVGVLRGADLRPVVQIETLRRVHRLVGDDGHTLADLADDQVTGRILAEAEHVERWRELEIELVDGDVELLDATQAVLLAGGATPATSSSKLGRLLEIESPAPHVLDAHATAGEVTTAYLAEQVAQLQRWDIEVRRDTPDSVHKARVAARRLRSALRTYRPLLDRSVTDPLRTELRWLGDVLGRARDAEVMRDRLLDLVSTQPADLVIGPVSERIESELGGGYRRALREAVSDMSDERYFTLLDALDALVDATPLTRRAAERADVVLPPLARAAWKAVRRLAAEAHADPQLHEVRKAAKRARYAGESMTAVFGDDADDFATAMEAVQEVLGIHQDAVVTRSTLRDIGDRAHLAGENAFTYGLLAGLEEGRAERSAAEFRDVLAAASRRSLHRWHRH